jgi:dihydroflavonol-4-reductase
MIFLTGATGLVGSFICRELLQQGHTVRALKRPDSKLTLLQDVAGEIEWVEGELLDILSLQKAMEGCRTVIHSAGLVSYNKRDEARLYQVNREGTANMVNAALQQQVEQFIHISSVGAVGRSAKFETIDETFSWSDVDEHTAYGSSKYQAELEAFRGGVEGLDTIILNPSVVLAPAPWEQSSTRLFKYVYDENPFYTDGWMNYVDARDLAGIVIAALAGKLKGGERYIVSGGCIPYKQFFDMAAGSLHKKAPSIRVNPYLLKGAYYLETVRARLNGKSPLITRETLKLASQRIKFSNLKITQAIDYQFTPLHETIAWTSRNLPL